MRKKGLSKNSVIEKKFDWSLFLLVIVISVFGIISIYTSTRSLGSNSRVIVQSVAFVLGLAGLLVMCFFDYEQFKKLAMPIMIVSVGMLVVVLLFGVMGTWGTRGWIDLGIVSIQPAEIAKLFFSITFAFHLSKVQEKINKIPVLFGLMLHLLIPVGLICLQPDIGSAMVFIFMFICMLFTAKLSYKYIIPALIIGIISLPLIYHFLLTDVQQERIQVFFNPSRDPQGRGYNVIQSKIAVGSGQLFGKGFLQGTQNQMGYLPMKYTDFIFSIICEEFGFIGAVFVTLGLFAVIFKCIRAAQRADNLFGKYLCTGIAAMLLFHTFENIGMCIGLMPVTGIPLPFLSYGGSSLVTNMLAIGIVMSVEYHNKPRNIFEVY